MAEEADTNDNAAMESIAQNLLEVRIRWQLTARSRRAVAMIGNASDHDRAAGCDHRLTRVRFSSILTGQCRRWWSDVRGERGGRIAVSGIADSRAVGAGGRTADWRRRHHVEQSPGIPVAAEETGRNIGVDPGER